ncbi:hypothetical protein [Acinetobacter sp. TGL-Y2]|nr:hypothetical protein [Acinetobacter sp. TGL-Y2]
MRFNYPFERYRPYESHMETAFVGYKALDQEKPNLAPLIPS